MGPQKRYYHSSKLENCSLTIRWSLVSLPGHPFLEGFLPFCGERTQPNLQGADAKYGIIFKTFFRLICPTLEKKIDKCKFFIIIQAFFQPNISEQEKKRQRIYDSLNAETKPPPKKTYLKWLISIWPPPSPDLNPLDFAMWNVLENKTNVTSHPNIDTLKIAIEEKWNKMFEEFILKACESFLMYVDTIILKNGGHIE